MANIKFSAFTQKVALADVDFLVGYTGADNVRVAPSVFSGLYLPLAGGTMTGDTDHGDSVYSYWGASNDLQIYHDGTDSYVSNTQNSGNLIIQNGGNDKDVIFKCDDGSGGITPYITLDGAFTKTIFSRDFWAFDNTKALFGTSADLEIYHDGSHSYITDTGTGSLILRGTDFQLNNSANTKNMITATDGGSVNLYYDAVQKFRTVSGGVEVTGTVYITGDGSNAATLTESGSGDFTISSIDDLRLESGGNDIVLRGASSAEFGRLSNDSQNLVIRNTNADKDIVFKGDDAGSAITALTLDMSEAGNAYFGSSIFLADSKYVYWGAANDFYIGHNGSNTDLINNTGNLTIANYANDKNIIFQCDDGAGGIETYFQLEGISGGSQPFTVWPDAAVAAFGSGHDLRIEHDGTYSTIDNYTGDFDITNYADDQNLNLRCDNGAGGTATYLSLNGAVGFMIAYKLLNFQDGVYATFGNSSDLSIYHDASNSYIVDSGTGSLKVGAANWHLMDSALTSYMMTATPGAECNLYYNGSGKFITTSDGVKVTGQYNVAALNTAPASASAAGTLGEIRYTADYIYVCTATNTWKRTALSTW